MPVRRSLNHVSNTLVTGLLAALPLAATVAIVVWLLRFLHEWLGPGSFVGRQLVRLGLDVFESDAVSWLVGLGVVVLAIYGLGLLVQTRLEGVWHRLVEGVLSRIPLVRHVYELVRKFVDLLQQRDESATRSMSPVWVHFGGPGQAAAVLGLLSTPEPVLLNGEPYLGVIVPTAPVPVGGALIYVPQAWVQTAPIGVDGLTSIYVSMGVTSAQHLGKA
ncbi:MAG: DUF502 domain-containing protein [Rubrivivax sp.]|jgi:uncharacterized membrane protein|nr:DUF502 domain-containing protein [Rubrivivax sp.]